MSISHLKVTPRAVLDTLTEGIDNVEEIYVVVVKKDKVASVLASGDLKGLAFAIMVLKDYFSDVFNS